MRINMSADLDAERARRALRAMEVRANNFRPVLIKAREKLERANAENFASNGLPVGGWERRKDDYAWPLMKRSGRLLNSLTNLQGPPNRIYRKTAVFGTRVEYAKFHQYGTSKMAKRKILFEPRRFGEEVAEDVAEWVARGNTSDLL